ncbi:heavy metal translocating P-type ATPase [Limnohabitans sp. 63ED37-2]|uniref:heavy metal translocating P-type ATPase n=1 Tax=Limnohabitans sp. 63ED37-2 TaxID=1678128 RepID=UPI00070694AA|nr:cation-translocating P-type ATPase [Limnohabitans sp. 63ED37-2]ALK88813.1 putative copper-transporting ATPase PacS [Limnohabitans sp. 63ED37-2]
MTQVNVLPGLPAASSEKGALVAMPLASSEHNTPQQRLALLDVPEEWAAFSLPEKTDSGCWRSSVVFEGMHCAACAITLEDALRAVPGVQSVQISGASHRGQIVWSPELTRPSEWMRSVERHGYKALPANDAHAHARRREEARRMVWRWAVAAMCMMQVMMYATPTYLSQPGDISDEAVHLLRWASWVLSLPVMFFSCTPFLRQAWRDLCERQISMDLPVALGMVVTFVVSTLGTFEPQGPFGAEVFFDSFTMFVFFLLTGRWLELRMRDRTAGALEAVLNRLPDSVRKRQSDGTWVLMSIRRLQVGDVIEVLPGEAFAGDGRVMVGQTQVDEALLTGESRPLARGVGDRVIAGSHNLSGTLQVQIEQIGAATRYAQIVALMESASVSKPAMAQLVDRWAKPFLVAVMLASLASAIYWWPSDPAHAVMVAVAVLIVTCPCALSLATPAAMLATAGALARSGVLVRRLSALQNLSLIDTVIFDKTGTLTRDAFEVARIHTREGVSAAQALDWAGSLARHSLHPVSRALWSEARRRAEAAERLQALEALAAHNVSELAGQGVQGALTPPGQATQTLRLGSAAFCAAPPRAGHHLQVSLADASGWLASFELAEQVRPEAAGVVCALSQMGLNLKVLSGDGPAAVTQVAQAVGIADAQGGCSPQHKLQALQALQALGHKVAMVGDGLNDGPVLAGADVSFALGQAVPLAQSKSDFVLMGGQLEVLVSTLQRSRQTMRIVRQNLWWSAAYNAACVPLALMGWLPAWAAGLGMALSSLLVVLNALRLSQALPESRQPQAMVLQPV